MQLNTETCHIFIFTTNCAVFYFQRQQTTLRFRARLLLPKMFYFPTSNLSELIFWYDWITIENYEYALPNTELINPQTFNTYIYTEKLCNSCTGNVNWQLKTLNSLTSFATATLIISRTKECHSSPPIKFQDCHPPTSFF